MAQAARVSQAHRLLPHGPPWSRPATPKPSSRNPRERRTLDYITDASVHEPAHRGLRRRTEPDHGRGRPHGRPGRGPGRGRHRPVARRDIALARAAVERDLKLDALHRDIEKKAIRLIALRQPVASDLRKALGAIKMASDLERTGDLAKNIAKRALILAEAQPMEAADPFDRTDGAAGVESPARRAGRLHRLRDRPAPSPSGRPTTRSTSTTTPCSANC